MAIRTREFAASVIMRFGARCMIMIMVVVFPVVSMSGITMGNAPIVPLMQGTVNHAHTHSRENAEKKK